jgi:hypothetical protein
MTGFPESEFARKASTVNTVAQIIALCVASVWAVWIFYWRELAVPRSAPINVTLDLQLKRVGGSGGDHPLIAIEMKTSATNPSSRKVFLLPSAFIVRGVKMQPPAPGNTFETRALALLNTHPEIPFSSAEAVVERSSMSVASSVLAVGRPFADNLLNPGEVTTHTLVLHVPAQEYDKIEATTWIPNTTKPGNAEIVWSVGQNSELRAEMYRVTTRGSRRPMERDEGGVYSANDLGLQFASSGTQLSLWGAGDPK